jgi:hypothetical protein
VAFSLHIYSAQIIDSPDTDIGIVGGSIDLDSRRAPHVQASLTCSDASPATLALLDPRLPVRVQIDVEARVFAGTQTRTFDLGLRRRPVPFQDGTFTLDLASDEALLTDYSPLANVDLSAFTGGRALVNEVLDQAIPGAELEAGDDFTISVDADGDVRLWKAGVSALEYLQPIVQASGLRLVCDEARLWTLRDEEWTAPGMLHARYGVNLMAGEDTIDRDSGVWFDAAIARYSWTDGGGVQLEQYDSYAATTPHTRSRTFDFDSPYPGPGFAEYAVRRAQGRGREVTFTLDSDWTAQAEQTTFLALDEMPLQVGATQSITFNLDDDTMTGTTRTVEASDYSYIAGEVGVSYNDVPVGMSYDEFDWALI